MANSRAVNITTNSAQVVNGNNNYYYDLSNITDATFWNNEKSDGGDIRVYHSGSDEQLPVDLVYIDTGSQTGELHFYTTHSVSGSSETYRIEYDDTSLTQPAVTDPNGRNAVWQEFEFVLHLNETGSTATGNYKDATGNGYNGTAGGATRVPTATTTDNPFGRNWADFDSSNDYISIDNSGNVFDNSFFTLTAISKKDANDGSQGGVLSNRDISQGNNYFQMVSGDTGLQNLLNDGSGNQNATGTNISTTAADWIGISSEVSSFKYYYDGSLNSEDTTIAGDNQFVTAKPIRIGAYYDVNSSIRIFPGKIGEVKGYIGTRSANYITEEYNNQSDNTNFWSTSDSFFVGPKAAEGGSESTVYISSEGDGLRGGKFGGTTSTVNISAEGNGGRLFEHGAEDTVYISAEGGGEVKVWPTRKAFDITSDATKVFNGNDAYYYDLSQVTDTQFWDNVQGNGNDIEVYHSASQQRVAVEVVNFDTGSQSGQLYFRSEDAVSGSSGTWQVRFDVSGTNQGAEPTDTYGRNNVWNGYSAVYHMEQDLSTTNLVDSTGNNEAIPQGGYASSDLVSGKLGKAIRSNGSKKSVVNGTNGISHGREGEVVNVSMWLRPTALIGGDNVPLFELRNNSGSAWKAKLQNDGTPANGWPIIFSSRNHGTGQIPSAPSNQFFDTALTKFNFVWNTNDNTAKGYRNGSSIFNASNWSNSVTGETGSLYIGNYSGSVSFQVTRVIDEFRIKNTVSSQSEIKEDYQVEQNNSSFWTTSAVYATSDTVRFGSSTSIVEITSDADGFKLGSNGSTDTIDIIGLADGTKDAFNGSEDTVYVIGEGDASKTTDGSATDTVFIEGLGSGLFTVRGGAETTVYITSDAGGLKTAQVGSDSIVEVLGEADGSKEGLGGTNSVVYISGNANGFRTALQGSTDTVYIEGEAFGTSTKLNGSESTVYVVGQGGDGSKATSGGDSSTITVIGQADGSKTIFNGSDSTIYVIGEGGGTDFPTFEHGAEDTVYVSAEADGFMAIESGGTATINVSGEGGTGIKLATQGEEGIVYISAEEGHTRSTSGSAESTVYVIEQADGSKLVTDGNTSVVIVEAEDGTGFKTKLSGGTDVIEVQAIDSDGVKKGLSEGGEDTIYVITFSDGSTISVSFEELKERANFIIEDMNSMHRQLNLKSMEIVLDILDNPKLFDNTK